MNRLRHISLAQLDLNNPTVEARDTRQETRDKRHEYPFFCLLSLVSCLSSLVSRLLSLVSCLERLAQFGRLVFIALLALFALTACGFGIVPNQGTPSGGGGSTPEQVAQYFFEDLGQALKDPQLSNEDRRDQWVERLANYFAPNERDDQRIALSSAL